MLYTNLQNAIGFPFKNLQFIYNCIYLGWQIICLKFRILRLTLRMIFFFKFIFLIVPVLLSVAFITLLERKLLSLVGFRLGPNKVSFGGIFQPITDALKLINKQNNSLSNFS